MVHWGFLILAFFAGGLVCFGVLGIVAGINARVMQAIEDTAKSIWF